MTTSKVIQVVRSEGNLNVLASAHPSDGGLDVIAAEDIEIAPFSSLVPDVEDITMSDGRILQRMNYPAQLIRTKVSIQATPPVLFFLMARSGFSTKYMLQLRNAVGLIDESYQGELLISVWNPTEFIIPVRAGERIAQLVILDRPLRRVEYIEAFEETTTRNTQGFGSSGITGLTDYAVPG
jgi:dUTP pyrophosphatase